MLPGGGAQKPAFPQKIVFSSPWVVWSWDMNMASRCPAPWSLLPPVLGVVGTSTSRASTYISPADF